jgi:Putative adhesin/Domain of unknown function (DUF5668)
VAADYAHPRRRSIFSGLILVLLGLLLLLNNFRAHFLVWQLLERWWPLLFIIWGLAKLYDRMVARRSGEAAPPTVTGGEIALVLLLLLVLAAAATMEWGDQNLVRGSWAPWWEESSTVSEEVPPLRVPAGAEVSIRAGQGDISIYGDDSAELRVTARNTGYGSSSEEAQNHASTEHISVHQTGNLFTVEPEQASMEGRPVRTDLEIHLPKGASVNVDAGDGVVEVAGVAGNISVNNRHANTEVRQAGGNVTIDNNHGDVTVNGASGEVKVSGRGGNVEISNVLGSATADGEFNALRFEHIAKGVRFLSRRSDLAVGQLNGRLEIETGEMVLSDAAGAVSLVTNNRDISFDRVNGHVHIENRSGTVSLLLSSSPQQPIEISNRSADINLTLPANSAFELDARADKGQIETEFGDSEKVSTLGSNAVLVDTLGLHGPTILLRTTYGTIHIRKGP